MAVDDRVEERRERHVRRTRSLGRSHHREECEYQSEQSQDPTDHVGCIGFRIR